MKTYIDSITIVVEEPGTLLSRDDLLDDLGNTFRSFKFIGPFDDGDYMVTIDNPAFALHTIQGRVAAIFSRHTEVK